MPLAKFCNFCGPINIWYCIQDDRVLDAPGDALTEWLYQDSLEANSLEANQVALGQEEKLKIVAES